MSDCQTCKPTYISQQAYSDFIAKDLQRIIDKVNAGAEVDRQRHPTDEIREKICVALGRDDFKAAYLQMEWKLRQKTKSKKLIITDGMITRAEPDCGIAGDMVTVILAGYKSHGAENVKGGKMQEILDSGKAPTVFMGGKSGLL